MMLRRTKVERVEELGLPPRVMHTRRDLFSDRESDFYHSLYADTATTFAAYVRAGTVLNHYAHIFVRCVVAGCPRFLLTKRYRSC